TEPRAPRVRRATRERRAARGARRAGAPRAHARRRLARSRPLRARLGRARRPGTWRRGRRLSRAPERCGAVTDPALRRDALSAALGAHVTTSDRSCLEAALRLHRHLEDRHLTGDRLAGPDQGVRWNIRVWRFWKSYFPALAPRERHFFLQGQGYWAL